MIIPLSLIENEEARALLELIEEAGGPNKDAALQKMDQLKIMRTATGDPIFHIAVLIGDYRSGVIDLDALKDDAIQVLYDYQLIRRER